MPDPTRPRVRIVHVVYGFGVGGLENVIVQLINRLPRDAFEHVVLSLTTIGEFRSRVEPADVQFIALDKPPGHAFGEYGRIYRLFRALKPDVVHTCNLAALEVTPIAWLAGVPSRIHAEHGWDAHDPQGLRAKYQRLRRLYRPFVSQYVAVSRDLDRYLGTKVGVPASRRSLIANGVDTGVFAPAHGETPRVVDCPFQPGVHWLVGTVGRLQTVKNQPLLARAFVRLLEQRPDLADRARLLVIGEGPLRSDVQAILRKAGLEHLAWMPGARSDVPAILQMLDVFVLPSQAEGTSCTLQEAMAVGLPVVATAVGGTPDLVEEGVTGLLVPSDDEQAMATALARLADDDEATQAMRVHARRLALQHFDIGAMVSSYRRLFDSRGKGHPN